MIDMRRRAFSVILKEVKDISGEILRPAASE
jgi:hypothetical protein